MIARARWLGVALLAACGGAAPAPAAQPVEPAPAPEPAPNPPPPPPPPPAADPAPAAASLPHPSTISPQRLETLRIAGTKDIVPPDVVKTKLALDGKTRLVIPVRFCIDATGVPSTVKFLRSSGYPEYDAVIEQEMLRWRYRPLVLDGTAVAVCTAVTFIYTQNVEKDDAPERGEP